MHFELSDIRDMLRQFADKIGDEYLLEDPEAVEQIIEDFLDEYEDQLTLLEDTEESA
jgi:hypothetical protein